MTTFEAGLNVDWALKGLGILALAFLTCLVLRRASAAARHAVWAAALTGILVLPAVATVVPALNLPQFAEPETARVGNGPLPGETHAPSPGGWLAYAPSAATSDAAASIAEDSAATLPIRPQLTWQDWIRGIWLAGAITLVVLYGCGLWRVRQLITDSQALPEPLTQALQGCVGELGLRRVVSGRLTRARQIPMTCGLFRHTILLPAESVAWPAARVRLVLLHELSHVRRHDCLVQFVCQLACAMHWFNPLAWVALVRLRSEQERSCDDMVLSRGMPAADYAATLLSVTAGAARLGMAGAVALAVGSAGRTERRIRDLLNPHRNRCPLSRRGAVSTISAAAVIVCAAAALGRPLPATGDESTSAPSGGVNIPNQPLTASSVAQINESEETRQATAVAPPAGETSLSTDAVRDLILKSTLQDVTAQKLNEAAIRGMLDSLHAPHSQLLVGEELRPFSEEPLVGIGAQLKSAGDAVVVTTPLPKSPALAAGLKANDTILAVDGHPLTNLTEAVKLLRGRAGSEVRLKVRRSGGEELELAITRGTIHVASVTGLYLDASAEWQYWLSRDTGLAYVSLTQFGPGTQGELQARLEQLDGLRGLVLDLRRCPGGLLNECLGVAKMFIMEGELLTIRGRQQEAQTFTADGTAAWADVPLVVLIDGMTASAGEVLAGALHARGRAVIVGDRSFGKGTVEQLIPLGAPGTALKLTTAEMELPGGRAMQRKPGVAVWGVDPTDGYYVPITSDEQKAWQQRRSQLEVAGAAPPVLPVTPNTAAGDLRDRQLGAALEALTIRIAEGALRPTGRPLAELTDDTARREALRTERERLRRELERVDKELQE